MNKNTVSIAVLALLIGFGGGFLLGSREPELGSHVMPSGSVMDDSGMSMGAEMENMTADLVGKTGDAFDQAFLRGMIVHHQGAVLMAETALGSAKHEEIKQMARAIISAQTTEISQMQAWQKSWYGSVR